MATRKMPRKPKFARYPKKPKASASLATLERYFQKVRDVDADNKKRQSEYEHELKQREADKKRHEELRRKIAGIGTHHDGLKRRSHSPHHRRRKAAVGKVRGRRKTQAHRRRKAR